MSNQEENQIKQNLNNDSVTTQQTQLGSTYGFTPKENPVSNALAISAWHSALSRVIAYVWEKWDDENEITNVLNYPEYYLSQFGFYPQIPAYQTKIRFVINKGDQVTYTQGGVEGGGTLQTHPGSDKANGRTVELNPTCTYKTKSEIFENDTFTDIDIKRFTASIVPISEIVPDVQNPSQMQIIEQLKKELDLTPDNVKTNLALFNGWDFKEMSDLTGCFVVAIPPRPEKTNLHALALGDFMDICRSQPFTSC